MNWDTVLEVKHNSGLGIRDPGLMNNALGAKLVWRMNIGEKEWWKEVIRKKYIKKALNVSISPRYIKGLPSKAFAKTLLV